MLQAFLETNREELIARCRRQAATRLAPSPTDDEFKYGIPLFLEQVVRTLQLIQASDSEKAEEISGPTAQGKVPSRSEIRTGATKHGKELHRNGLTVDQVVHDYGDLCQAVTNLAVEQGAPITVDEFRTFNSCLDDAIADAVTEYGNQRAQSDAAAEGAATNERMGHLAHELRNDLNAAMLALQAVKRGTVGISGATGAVLERSLCRMRDLIDRSLAEVRVTAGSAPRLERFAVADLIEEIQVASGLEAASRGVSLSVEPVASDLLVNADRQMIASAVANLLQNAFKFTKARCHVSLRTRAGDGRVFIEVEDECGGLPQGKAEELFAPFIQKSVNRTGLGLGLSICQRGVEASGGTVQVRNLPGKGCVFTIELPLERS